MAVMQATPTLWNVRPRLKKNDNGSTILYWNCAAIHGSQAGFMVELRPDEVEIAEAALDLLGRMQIIV